MILVGVNIWLAVLQFAAGLSGAASPPNAIATEGGTIIATEGGTEIRTEA